MAKDPAAPGAPDAPLYPSDYAFVIALRRDADVVHGQFAGRVEHMSSGRAASFASVDVLLEFMRRAAGEDPARNPG
jgi:hypothetical protein